MIRILVTGARGLLGSNIINTLKGQSGIKLIGTDLIQSEPEKSFEFVSGNLLDPIFFPNLAKLYKPDIIINTVALPDVDRCETEPDLAKKLNVETAITVAQAAEKTGCRMLHISTDQLFTGEKPFSLEKDPPKPVNNYARTKLEAENVVLKTIDNSVVVRTNFYGWSPTGHGKTFGEWLYKSLKENQPVRLITDYYFTPIEVSHFVNALKAVAESSFCGILNIAGRERCSKYDFGMAMAKEFGFKTDNIVQCLAKEMPKRVERPKDISLSVKMFSSIFNFKLPDVKTGLRAFKQQMSVQ